jgi:hypothetical protein
MIVKVKKKKNEEKKNIKRKKNIKIKVVMNQIVLQFHQEKKKEKKIIKFFL